MHYTVCIVSDNKKILQILQSAEKSTKQTIIQMTTTK